MPGSLEESLDELEADHDSCSRATFFTEDVPLDLDRVQARRRGRRRADAPAPHEFELYFDV